jgi:Sjoegren syndrome nuclear autoantigen 1
MSKQGAALQTYNNELVKCLDELFQRRKALQEDIDVEKAEKAKLEVEMEKIRSRLDQVRFPMASVHMFPAVKTGRQG